MFFKCCLTIPFILLIATQSGKAQDVVKGKAHKTYHPNGKIHTVSYQGSVGGCGVPIGPDSTFTDDGKLKTKVTYRHTLKKGDPCHDMLTIRETVTYHPNGKPSSVVYHKFAYEGAPVAMGRWRWYNNSGEVIRMEAH